MYQELICDEKLQNFFKEMYIENVDLPQLEQNTVMALAKIADSLRLGRAQISLDAPSSKLRPEGAHANAVLFERKEGIGTEEYKVSFKIPDGGEAVVALLPWGEPFSEQERGLLEMISAEIFSHYSNTIMRMLLQHVMVTDLPTGVASFEFFMQNVGRLLAMHRLQDYELLFFNIHNFKYVNKVLPYTEGDIVLKNYAQKVKSLLLADELLARLGGDNFLALVRKERRSSIIVALQNMQLTYKDMRNERKFRFGATIGYTALEGIHAPSEVMARSSIAFQAARQAGAGRAVEYTQQIQQEVMENQSVISTFHAAMELGEFAVYYQPKVTIADHKICGAEALVRWFRDGRLVQPADFVPQLEREGSICQLDYYMLEAVCRFLSRRQKQGKKPICISVNFSRRHLEESDLIEHIVSIIDRFEIDHSSIEIELTESQDYQNYEIMTGVVNELRTNGIATSMDDFGTGFSSLNMIKEVDLNVIKIDKSFIPLEQDYPDKERDRIIFCNIVSLIKQLGKKTIAEGVETPSQLEYLREAGCDIVQGFVFDEPLSEAEFEERLEKGYEEA